MKWKSVHTHSEQWTLSLEFNSHVGLESPFTTSLHKRHVAAEDLSIPEQSPWNKETDKKLISQNMQFAESMGQLWLAIYIVQFQWSAGIF